MLDLRPITAGDAAAVHELLGDPAVATWLRRAGEDGPFTLAECETMVARAVAHWAAHGFGRSLAWERRPLHRLEPRPAHDRRRPRRGRDRLDGGP